jgi:teichoic acid transport system ATP-binding protein
VAEQGHGLVDEAARSGMRAASEFNRHHVEQALNGSLSDVSVVLDDVDVVYRVYEDSRPRFFDVVRGKGRRQHRRIHAVKAVSMIARSGETIGIVGANGSGKSTLLAALAGLLPVESGHVYARSHPTLLGVGGAMQPEVSARRNVMLGCLALGMGTSEARQRLDEIVDFAGVRDFIDLPLTAYSSGMKARLLFSIATAVVPDILIIDEALAVGDEQFRDRSRERINELRKAAGTVFVVTHNLDHVVDTCTRVVWLNDGRLQSDGEPDTVVREYRDWTRKRKPVVTNPRVLDK